MNTRLFLALTAYAGAVLQAFSAVASIQGSHHDLAIDGEIEASPCEFCHPPHVRNELDDRMSTVWINDVPKENDKAEQFNLYDARPTPSRVLGPTSLICLGCHDGTIAKIIRTDSRSAATKPRLQEEVFTLSAFYPINAGADHPVGFIYQDDPSPGGHGVPVAVFKPPFGMDSMRRGFTIYGDEGSFECTTCHNPHDNMSGQTANKGTAKRGGSSFFLRGPLQTFCNDCHLRK